MPTRNALRKKSAEDVFTIAAGMGIAPTEEMTKDQAIERILKAQGGDHREWSEAMVEADQRDIAARLAEQPKVRLKLWQVPEDSTDKPLPDEVVIVNGHSYQIKRGETVEVPETVAEILEQAGRY